MLLPLYAWGLFGLIGSASYAYVAILRCVGVPPRGATALSVMPFLCWCFARTFHSVACANFLVLSSRGTDVVSAAAFTLGFWASSALVMRRPRPPTCVFAGIFALCLIVLPLTRDNEKPWTGDSSKALLGGPARRRSGSGAHALRLSSLLGLHAAGPLPGAVDDRPEAAVGSRAPVLMSGLWGGWFADGGQTLSLGKQFMTFHADGVVNGHGEMNQQRINSQHTDNTWRMSSATLTFTISGRLDGTCVAFTKTYHDLQGTQVDFDGCLSVRPLGAAPAQPDGEAARADVELVISGVYVNVPTGGVGLFELSTRQGQSSALWLAPGPGADSIPARPAPSEQADEDGEQPPEAGAPAGDADEASRQTAWYEMLRSPSTGQGRSRRQSMGILMTTFGFRVVIVSMFGLAMLATMSSAYLMLRSFLRALGLVEVPPEQEGEGDRRG